MKPFESQRDYSDFWAVEDDDDNKVDFTAIVPGALFTVTYH